MIVTKIQLELMFVEWKVKMIREFPEDCHDDYYWHGAYSFKDFLGEKLVIEGINTENAAI